MKKVVSLLVIFSLFPTLCLAEPETDWLLTLHGTKWALCSFLWVWFFWLSLFAYFDKKVPPIFRALILNLIINSIKIKTKQLMQSGVWCVNLELIEGTE